MTCSRIALFCLLSCWPEVAFWNRVAFWKRVSASGYDRVLLCGGLISEEDVGVCLHINWASQERLLQWRKRLQRKAIVHVFIIVFMLDKYLNRCKCEYKWCLFTVQVISLESHWQKKRTRRSLISLESHWQIFEGAERADEARGSGSLR